MQILVLSDHSDRTLIPDINPDVIFLLGDLDYYFIRHIDQKFSCPKFGVLGNHDGPDFFDGTGIINIHKKVVEFCGLKIGGFEGSPTYNKRKYLQYDEIEVYDYLKDLEKVDFFLAHSNPMDPDGKFDLNDGHRGFASFNYYIKERKPIVFLHGHLHENKQYQMEETTILSVYPVFVFQF